MSVPFAAAARRRHSTVPPAPSVAVQVADVALAIDDSVDVTVYATRTNYSGTIALTAEDLPLNVEASFVPATLGPGVSESVLTLTSNPAASVGNTPITVVAACERLANIDVATPLSVVRVPGNIPLTLSRRDGGSGSTLVNTGIPLAQGELAPAAVGDVALFINNVEVARWAEDLGLHHPDGSVAFLLLQWTGDPATVTSCELAMSGRTVTPASKTACPRIPSTFFASAASRCVVMPRTLRTVPVGDPRLPTWMSQWDTFYASRIALEDAFGFTQWNSGRTIAPYDHGATMIKYGFRAADAYYWHRALTMGQTITTNSLNYTWVQGNVLDYTTFDAQAFALCYWLTGNEDYRTAGAHHGRRMVEILSSVNWFGSCGTESDDLTGVGDLRTPARALQGFLFGVLTGASFGTATLGGGSWTYAADATGLATFLTHTLRQIAPSGDMGGSYYTETVDPFRKGQKPFMVHMQNVAWTQYYELFAQDTRIPTAIAASAAFTIAQDWEPDGRGGEPGTFRYVTYANTVSGNNQFQTGNSLPSGVATGHALNNFCVLPYLWIARRTSDDAMKAFVQTAVEACWLGRTEFDTETAGYATKAFDEAYFCLFEAQRELLDFA